MNSTPSSTPSQGTQLVGWPLQAGLARTEFSQFFSFTGTVQSTSDVWCGRLLKMTQKPATLLLTPCLKILSRFHRLIATLHNEI